MEEAKKPSSITAPDPDAIPPQIRQKEQQMSEERNQAGPRLFGPAPFDSDDVAVKERDGIDYTTKVNIKRISMFSHLIQRLSKYRPEVTSLMLAIRKKENWALTLSTIWDEGVLG